MECQEPGVEACLALQAGAILCTALWRSYQISALERIGQSDAAADVKDFMLRRLSVFGTLANNEEKSPPLGRRLQNADCRLAKL